MVRIIGLLLIIVSMTVYGSVQPTNIFIPNASDTTEINRVLAEMVGNRSNIGEIAIQVAKQLEGRAYVAHTLEDSIERLTINMQQFDCTTFVETVVAMSLTTQISNPTWRDYARYLEMIRYRNGEMNGYVSRLHYFSEWITDNAYRGNIKEVTTEIASSSTMVKSINYMSKHASEYPALKDSSTLDRIKQIEMGYRNHQMSYLKKEVVSKKSTWNNLRNGDIIVVLSKTEGLDVSHVGFIIMVEGKPHLLHASKKAGKIIIDEMDLKEYFKREARNSPGVRILRICN